MKPLAAEHPKGLLAGFETGPDNMPPWDGRTTLALLVAITISNSVNMTKFQRNESHLFAPPKQSMAVGPLVEKMLTGSNYGVGTKNRVQFHLPLTTNTFLDVVGHGNILPFAVCDAHVHTEPDRVTDC